jgi:hypothetical protein
MLDTEIQLPSRSLAGKAALDIFYNDFNEVNFYVEDEDQENLDEEILRKVLPQVKFKKIFPLGGKSSVLKHAANKDNESLDKKCIYIVDKDFDDFLDKVEQDERLFYLERYCVENYLLEEQAIVNVLIETYPKKKAVDIQNQLNLPNFFAETSSALTSLFTYFLCAQKLELGIKNCDCKPEEYSAPAKNWCIDSIKVALYWDQVQLEATHQHKTQLLMESINDFKCYVNEATNYNKLISGKFLIALLFHYVKNNYKMGSITLDSFVFRVAKNCFLDDFQPIADRIKAYIESPTTP